MGRNSARRPRATRALSGSTVAPAASGQVVALCCARAHRRVRGVVVETGGTPARAQWLPIIVLASWHCDSGLHKATWFVTRCAHWWTPSSVLGPTTKRTRRFGQGWQQPSGKRRGRGGAQQHEAKRTGVVTLSSDCNHIRSCCSRVAALCGGDSLIPVGAF